MLIFEEGVSIGFAEVSFNPADSQIHLGHLPRGRIALLAEYRNVIDAPLMALDELG